MTVMNKKRYLQILVYFAKADSHHDVAELEFIRQVGNRLEIPVEEIEDIINSDYDWEPEFPKSEVERFILFDDILDLIAADNMLTEKEEIEARKVAQKLGFMPAMVDEIFNNMRKQIQHGLPLNKKPQSFNSKINNSSSYGKYNQ